MPSIKFYEIFSVTKEAFYLNLTMKMAIIKELKVAIRPPAPYKMY